MRGYERLAEPLEAERVYTMLTTSPAAAWQAVGQSALDVLHKHAREALAAATKAVSANPALAEAQYQLGLALTVNQHGNIVATAATIAEDVNN